MSNSWFRMHAEALDDPKVQRLSGDLFKLFINTLCLACKYDGVLPSVEDCSFAFRLPLHETKSAFHDLEKVGLLVTDGETFQVKNWKKRQFKSDTSTIRVKRYRERYRNVTETAPDTEQNRADTESKKVSKSRGTRLSLDALPAEWKLFCIAERPDLDPEETFRIFTDHWRALPGQRGCKLDWEGTWRNWVRREKHGNIGKLNSADHANPAKSKWAAAAEQYIAKHSQPAG